MKALGQNEATRARDAPTINWSNGIEAAKMDDPNKDALNRVGFSLSTLKEKENNDYEMNSWIFQMTFQH